MRNGIFIIMVCICVMLFFGVITYGISQYVILEGVKDIEIREAEESIARLNISLDFSRLRLHLHASDWASTEAVYQLVKRRDILALAERFTRERLHTLNFASAMFFDISGNLLYSISKKSEEDDPFFSEAEKLYLEFIENMKKLSMNSLSSLSNISGTSVFISVQQIKNLPNAEPVGYLVLSRLVDESFLSLIQDATQLSITQKPLSTYAMVREPELKKAIKIVRKGDICYVYALINDFFAKPSLCFEIRIPRVIVMFGVHIAERNFFYMLIIGLLILLGGLYLLHRVHRRFVAEEIKFRAEHDGLTGLPNKLLFAKHLPSVLEKARTDNMHTGVLFLDLDRFKRVNNSYGYGHGDQLLREVAFRLQTFFPNSFVARQSGDEFLLVSVTQNQHEFMHFSHNVLAAIHQPFVISNSSVHIGASIGIATSPEDGFNPEVLIHRAELAMYMAKESGRDNVCFFLAEMDEDAFRKKRLETELYEALENNWLTVFYQPKVDIKRLDVEGCEALIRWKAKNGKWVPPPAFIPLAEEIGLVTRIDMFVLRSACRQTLEWKRIGMTIPVAVNMSAKTILSEGFAEQVIQILQEEGTPAELIDIEITESTLMNDLETAQKAISALHKAGMRIALDDFGTGYSSLQYLSEMPISALKIDKKFVDDIFSVKETAKPLVKSILSLASNLGMKTVSEGVENKSQLDFLIANGANIIQGYLFSKPLSGTDCSDFLINRKSHISAVMNAG